MYYIQDIDRKETTINGSTSKRVTPIRSFTHTGIDYANSFIIKTWKGQIFQSIHSYYFSALAIHSLVIDYTADIFIAAFKRFAARRGIFSTLTSNCGTNLKGVDSELR